MESKFEMTVKTIILSDDLKIQINEQLLFPHRKDGFHLWEAGIVLSRYLMKHKDKLIGKKVLELGSGVGIGGITALKIGVAKQVVLSDYLNDILENAIFNMKLNKVQTKKSSIMNLDWRDYKNFHLKFDIIIASDIVYDGCPLKDLSNLIKTSLNKNGEAWILIPNQRFKAEGFVKLFEE